MWQVFIQFKIPERQTTTFLFFFLAAGTGAGKAVFEQTKWISVEQTVVVNTVRDILRGREYETEQRLILCNLHQCCLSVSSWLTSSEATPQA